LQNPANSKECAINHTFIFSVIYQQVKIKADRKSDTTHYQPVVIDTTIVNQYRQ